MRIRDAERGRGRSADSGSSGMGREAGGEGDDGGDIVVWVLIWWGEAGQRGRVGKAEITNGKICYVITIKKAFEAFAWNKINQICWESVCLIT